MLEKKYGGYVIEEDGIIVMACDDEFAAEIEAYEKANRLFTEDDTRDAIDRSGKQHDEEPEPSIRQ
jgi:hypothetical protein